MKNKIKIENNIFDNVKIGSLFEFGIHIIQVIGITPKYVIINKKFDGRNDFIKIRKKDGCVMGGVFYGYKYLL